MDVDHRGLVDDEHVGGSGLSAEASRPKASSDEPLADRIARRVAGRPEPSPRKRPPSCAGNCPRSGPGHRDDRLAHATRGLARRSGKIDGRSLFSSSRHSRMRTTVAVLPVPGLPEITARVPRAQPHGLGLEFVGVQGARELLDERGRHLGKRARGLRRSARAQPQGPRRRTFRKIKSRQARLRLRRA